MKSLVRLVVVLLLVVCGLVSYCGSAIDHSITGKQPIELSAAQEVALGQQARQQMVSQYGDFYPDKLLRQYVNQVGTQVVGRSSAAKSPYIFEFHLLRDPLSINAFALPGGQVFLTVALLKRLHSEAQLAAVLGHEIGHVVARHGAEHVAKQSLNQSLAAVVEASTSDRAGDQVGNGSQQTTALAKVVKQLVTLRYDRADELESDRLGVRFMTEAGYDPQGAIQLIQILDDARQNGQPPAFFSTHPSPDNRVKRLQTLITQTYPQGIPRNLKNNRDAFTQMVLTRL